jgi:hypothetical protein
MKIRVGPAIRIPLAPAVSQANFRIAPLARPDLVERQPELLAHHLTAAGDIERNGEYSVEFSLPDGPIQFNVPDDP